MHQAQQPRIHAAALHSGQVSYNFFFLSSPARVESHHVIGCKSSSHVPVERFMEAKHSLFPGILMSLLQVSSC
jgi:hypothetical protein